MFNKKLKKEIESLKKELLVANTENVCLNRKICEMKTISDKLHKTEKELEKMKDIVRKQTEADILLNALKAVGIIKTKEEKPKEYYFNEMVRLQQQATSLSQTNTPIGAALYGLGGSFLSPI